MAHLISQSIITVLYVTWIYIDYRKYRKALKIMKEFEILENLGLVRKAPDFYISAKQRKKMSPEEAEALSTKISDWLHEISEDQLRLWGEYRQALIHLKHKAFSVKIVCWIILANEIFQIGSSFYE